MVFVHLFLCLLTLHASYSDWVSEWMSPVQEQFDMYSIRKSNDADVKFLNEDSRMVPASRDYPESVPKEVEMEEIEVKKVEMKPDSEMSAAKLKVKLESTLQSAKILEDTLKTQITNQISRENLLKEAIINGRSGVSTVMVSTMTQLPRSYVIKDGRWSQCNGMIQMPAATLDSPNLFNALFSEPRCIGKEIITRPDPCTFNSIIKYETVPTRRSLGYSEEDFLCLKPSFNKTLERYMSVTKRLMNETCLDGTIRSLADNNVECGIRTLSEYSFYPHKSSSAASLPLEYCVEKDGSCKLTVAWHVSNSSIENFEFLKDDPGFKKYFLNSGPYIEHVL